MWYCMQSFIIPIYNVFVDVHEILITRLKKNISRVLFYVKKENGPWTTMSGFGSETKRRLRGSNSPGERKPWN